MHLGTHAAGAGSVPATSGCFPVTVTLCTSWSCTGGVEVIYPHYSLTVPFPASDSDLARLAGSRGATLITGVGARVGKSSFIWSGISLPVLPGRWTRRKSPSLNKPLAERMRESQGPAPAVLGGRRQGSAKSPGKAERAQLPNVLPGLAINNVP